MTSPEELVAALRKFGAEATAVEAKRAGTDLPQSVMETLSAFSNTPGGGTILLGVDEGAGFAAVGVADAKKVMADLASWARDRLVPPLQPGIDIAEVDGVALVIVEVPELDRSFDLTVDLTVDLTADGFDAGINAFPDAATLKSWQKASDALGGVDVYFDNAVLSLNSSEGISDSVKIAPKIAAALGGTAHGV